MPTIGRYKPHSVMGRLRTEVSSNFVFPNSPAPQRVVRKWNVGGPRRGQDLHRLRDGLYLVRLQRRPLGQEPRKAMNRIDEADVWVVVISLVALVVSGLSWWDVRQQLRLSSRPGFRETLFGTSRRCKLKVKNLGQTTAIDVHDDMDYRTSCPTSRATETVPPAFN